jgi:hypothetical protein
VLLPRSHNQYDPRLPDGFDKRRCGGRKKLAPHGKPARQPRFTAPPGWHQLRAPAPAATLVEHPFTIPAQAGIISTASAKQGKNELNPILFCQPKRTQLELCNEIAATRNETTIKKNYSAIFASALSQANVFWKAASAASISVRLT